MNYILLRILFLQISDINLQLEGLIMTIDANNKKGYFTKDNEVGSIAFDLVINDEVSQIYEI